MKIVKILSLSLGLSLPGIANSYALSWTPQERDCTATLTYTVKIAGVEVEYTETWEGTKQVCKDGDSLCWASDCS